MWDYPKATQSSAHAGVPAAVVSGAAVGVVLQNLGRVVDRLIQILDDETAAFAKRDYAQLADFNHQKGHAFLDLTRAVAAAGSNIAGDADMQPRLVKLRKAIERNSKVVHLHLSAVSEITDTIMNAMREAEGDGTYTQSSARPKRGS